MANIESMIKWMTDRQGKVTYSMNSRLGPNSYDCSSAVYFALQAGGFLSAGKMGNTDSLFGDLECIGWKQVALNSKGYYDVKRGDIFIWGIRGSSGGASGHTGIFLDTKDTIIHCNYGYNGITVNNHDVIWAYNNRPAVTIYRYSGQMTTTPTPSPNGNWLPEKATFTCTVDEIILRGETTDKTPSKPISLSILGKIKNGQKVAYDAYLVEQNGYVWIRQPRVNGKYGYLPTGRTVNGKRSGTAWGVFN